MLDLFHHRTSELRQPPPSLKCRTEHALGSIPALTLLLNPLGGSRDCIPRIGFADTWLFSNSAFQTPPFNPSHLNVQRQCSPWSSTQDDSVIWMCHWIFCSGDFGEMRADRNHFNLGECFAIQLQLSRVSIFFLPTAFRRSLHSILVFRADAPSYLPFRFPLCVLFGIPFKNKILSPSQP